jgi:hypothetical protein
LDAEVGQFFEGFARHEVVTRGFLRRKVIDYCLYLGSFEAVDKGFELERVSISDVRVSSRVELGSDG